MDNFHGPDTKGTELVNYTTSIPSNFSKREEAGKNKKGGAALKISESPNREEREINIIMNKNRAAAKPKTFRR